MTTSLESLIAEMDRVVAECRERGSRAGYFAALYRNVTREVAQRIASGRFADAERMATFTEAFARRYLDAYGDWRNNRPVTESWGAAFAMTNRWRPLILQHLLLGMNAHINLDLGVVAAEAGDHYGLDAIADDFHQINELLAEMIVGCQQAVSNVSPWLGLLDRLGGRNDTTVVRFSLVRAREAAWHTAQRLAPLPPPDRGAAIKALDRDINKLGRLVTRGPLIVNVGALVVRLRERSNVRQVIDALATPVVL
jgi:hypothetical protein